MAVSTGDLNRHAGFTVELAVAVVVLLEMAIDAVHAAFRVNVLQMDGFVPFFRVPGWNDLVLFVEQITLSVLLIYVLKHPAVPMCIGELDVL